MSTPFQILIANVGKRKTPVATKPAPSSVPSVKPAPVAKSTPAAKRGRQSAPTPFGHLQPKSDHSRMVPKRAAEPESLPDRIAAAKLKLTAEPVTPASGSLAGKVASAKRKAGIA